MALAGGGHRGDGVEHLRGRFPVGVRGVSVGGSEDASAVDRGIEDDHAARGGILDEALGAAVHQGQPVVHEHGIEDAELHITGAGGGMASGHSDCPDLAPVPEVHQGFDRTARSRELVEVVELGIMQMHEREVIDPQAPAALLDGRADAVTGIVAAHGIDLGDDQGVVGAGGGQGSSDPALALTAAVIRWTCR